MAEYGDWREFKAYTLKNPESEIPFKSHAST
jgi:hypothetical protein